MRKILKWFLLYLRYLSISKAYALFNIDGATNRQLVEKFDILKDGFYHILTDQKISKSGIRLFQGNLTRIDNFLVHNKIVKELPDSLVVQVGLTPNPIIIAIRSYEEYQLFHEVFEKQAYSFRVPNSIVVIDVGMNIGFASLYFASMPNVSKVYSYELLPSTWLHAQNNFKLNNLLNKKIASHDFGWAASENSFQIPELSSGDVGATVMGFMPQPKSVNNNLITVNVKSAVEQLKKISNDSSVNLLLKLDCEGSEYEIIESLQQAMLLKRIQVLLIEWHMKGPDAIIDILAKENFTVFSSFIDAHMPLGFIYAVNRQIV